MNIDATKVGNVARFFNHRYIKPALCLASFPCNCTSPCISCMYAAQSQSSQASMHGSTQQTNHTQYVLVMLFDAATGDLCCSCDGGNLNLEVVRARGHHLPHVALFANRQIKQGEELTFSYGQSRPEPSPSEHCGAVSASMHTALAALHSTPRHRRQCLCGTTACMGFLPGV